MEGDRSITMLTIVYFLLAMGLGLVLRLVFLTSKDATDEWLSLWDLHRLKGRRWVTQKPLASAVDGMYGYPVLSMFIISRFPRRRWGFAGRLLNAVYDLVAGLFVFVPLALLFPDARVAGLPLAAAGLLIFLTTPQLLTGGSGMARMATMKARSLGLLLVTAYFTLVFLAMHATGAWLWVAGLFAAATGVLIVLASQFGWQVMVFFSIVISVARLTPIPMVILGVVVLAGITMPGLGARDVLRWWLGHKVWYWHIRDFPTSATVRDRWRDYVAFFSHLLHDRKQAFEMVLKRLSLVIVALNAPVVVLAGVLWVAVDTNFTGGSAYVVSACLAMLLAALLTMLATMTRWLIMLGQPERYFEYAGHAAVIVFAACLTRIGPDTAAALFWLLLLFNLCVAMAYVAYFRRAHLVSSSTDATPRTDDLLAWFGTNAPDARVAISPIKESYVLSTRSMETGVAPGVEYYHRFIVRPGEWGMDNMKEVGDGLVQTPRGVEQFFDAVGATPEILRDKYGLTHLVLGNAYAEPYREQVGAERFSEIALVYENPDYEVYSLERPE